jgi:isopropylmalate/homocitrate/citramalate synthase
MATTNANTAALIYDWNEKERTGPLLRKPPRFVDESIRDGIQSPSVRDPSIEQKMELVRLMDRMGVHAVNLGLPGAGKRAQEDCGSPPTARRGRSRRTSRRSSRSRRRSGCRSK